MPFADKCHWHKSVYIHITSANKPATVSCRDRFNYFNKPFDSMGKNPNIFSPFEVSVTLQKCLFPSFNAVSAGKLFHLSDCIGCLKSRGLEMSLSIQVTLPYCWSKVHLSWAVLWKFCSYSCSSGLLVQIYLDRSTDYFTLIWCSVVLSFTTI